MPPVSDKIQVDTTVRSGFPVTVVFDVTLYSGFEYDVDDISFLTRDGRSAEFIRKFMNADDWSRVYVELEDVILDRFISGGNRG